jgi:hypothetical protein
LPRIHQARDVILARRKRDHDNQARLFEATTKHVVNAVAGSALGAKKGAGQKAAERVQFVRSGSRRPREVTVGQGAALFGSEPLVPEGMTAAEVIAHG